ncbi:MAG: sensor domain-containing diguanylate cyclase [Gammaproteobacteria bacterium]|nr:sensor domain-containing diguanylate cyclase [Gammaproteobacteria bacterium]
MRDALRLIFVCSSLIWSLQAKSAAIDVLQENTAPIGTYIQYYLEDTQVLTLAAAIQLFQQNKFISSNKASLNFGIGSAPVWLRFEVNNPAAAAVINRLSVETSWMDKLTVYFVREGQLVKQQLGGDELAYSERKIKNIFFVYEYAFEAGTTDVYIRAETPDPMVLPVYLNSPGQFASRHSVVDHSYGFVYGAIVTLMAYNLMLFFSLKSRYYLYYSVYLFSFLLCNMSYSGYGYQWFWPQSPVWQQWSNPLLMMMFLLSGLLFATRFLKTKYSSPRVYNTVIFVCSIYVVCELLAVLLGQQVIALTLSFTFVFLFSMTMVSLGAISFYAGNQSAKYFLIASVSHVIGSSITAMTVWGITPYSTLAYRAVDIGMVIDAALLAFALAHQLRVNQEARVTAEKQARIDPLTGVNNRRAFYEYTQPMWSVAKRKHYPVSVVLLDVDKFKRINDRYGHSTGDKVLMQIAGILRHDARSGDVLARWGGEEFILFLPDTDLSEAESIANRLRVKVSQATLTGIEKHDRLTVSMGVAYTEVTAMSLDDLIEIADSSLYRAKTQGRDMVCVESASPEIS